MGFYQKMADDRKKGLLGSKPKYKVLQVDMLKQQDREAAASVTSFMNSSEDAHRLAGQAGFSYRDLDLRGRCGVVVYKGVEVALLFKREMLELEPGPADPVPQNVLKEPSEVWLKVDLLSAEPVEKRKGLGDRLSKAMEQVSRLSILWEEQKSKRARAEEEAEKLRKDAELARGLREKLGLMDKEKEKLELEVEGLRRDLKKSQEERRSDKLTMVGQMFPVFDTVWLAGLHRVGDTLYGMVKQQMMEGLAKVGVKLLAPAVGDTFDPNLHNAVHGNQFPRGSKEIGTVVHLHRVGWQLGASVTPAEVAVGIEQREEEGDGRTEARGDRPSEGGVASPNNAGGDRKEVSGSSQELG